MRQFLQPSFNFLAFSLGHCYNYRIRDFISTVLQPSSITYSFLCLQKAQLKEELQGHSLQARAAGKKFSVATSLCEWHSKHQMCTALCIQSQMKTDVCVWQMIISLSNSDMTHEILTVKRLARIWLTYEVSVHIPCTIIMWNSSKLG